jgi:hypothetical protein
LTLPLTLYFRQELRMLSLRSAQVLMRIDADNPCQGISLSFHCLVMLSAEATTMQH